MIEIGTNLTSVFQGLMAWSVVMSGIYLFAKWYGLIK